MPDESPTPFDPFGSNGSVAVDDDGLIPVELPSGAIFEVLTEEEAEHLTDRAAAYLEGFAFAVVSDVAEVDRLVCFEMLVHRYQRWLGRRKDYAGHAVDENQLQNKIKEISIEIRQIKSKLGIDKVTRDRQRGEGSVAQRWANVLVRAKAFGVMREEQSAKAIELGMQLISLMDVRRNTTLAGHPEDAERLHLTDDDILEWIDKRFREELTAVDAYFRSHEMRYWVRSQ